MAHVADWKKKEVQELKKLIEEYDLVGIVSIANLPSLQFQIMRANLRDSVLIKIARRRLIRLALEGSSKFENPEMKKLLEFAEGQIGLLFTKDDPFKLYKTLKKSRTATFIKAGQVAPKDIVVKEGPTPFAPGAIIGELAQVGVKTGVDKGKVAIKADSVVAKKGDVVSEHLAGVLKRLNILPMEIGLNLLGVFDGEIVYDSEILDVDESAYLSQLTSCASNSYLLSLEIGYPTKENIEAMIGKTYRDSKVLALEQEIFCGDLAEDFVTLAQKRAMALDSLSKNN
jgi:large subunit ribosomal protein L10